MYGPYWPRFGAYWQSSDGARELLAYDWRQCAGGIIPVMTRKVPVKRVDATHPEENDGTFYVQDVYLGPRSSMSFCAISKPSFVRVSSRSRSFGSAMRKQ